MTIAFVDGRVIVGDGCMIENAAVLVEDGKILKIAQSSKNISKDTQKISLAGRTLLPGFIDAHIHICMDGSPDPMAAFLSESPTITALKAARSARRTLMAGITTVRDMGGKDGIDFGLRQAINSGLIPGPRMLISGRLICMTGGHGWQVGLEANGPDEVRQAAREQIKAGVSIAAGTDAGTPFNLHGENLREIKLLVDYGGFSPMGAIEAGTGVAARVLGLDEELGTVEEGKVADLVMVEGNPLDDIDVLLNPESICLVMQGGKIVKGDSNNQFHCP